MVGSDMWETSQEARLSQLDRALPMSVASQSLTDELFAVVDLLAGEPGLRRVLTDPGRLPQQRQELARTLLAEKISPAALDIVLAGVGLAWKSGRALEAALERQGIRSELSVAMASGTLDEVEKQLLSFAALVEKDNELREAIADRRVSVEKRQELVSTLLSGKVAAATIRLAKRAIAARERTFALTVESYLALSGLVKERLVARVTVARPLPADQADRLQAALSRQAGRLVDIHVTVDPSIIGGVRVTLGDDVIEGTVAGRLDNVRRQLG
ncbi:MAG: F0F1 ATP synthase subunit delta [Propionibacteriaceae bacterium]